MKPTWDLSARPVAWVLAGLMVIAGAASFADDRFLHDEGLLTQTFSLLAARDVLPTFFLQKSRPPLALLYAPVATMGVGPFVWAHLFLSALAVPLVAGTARRLGHRMPNLAAAVVALSPMYVAGGASGVSNADAVLGVAIVFWLWAHEREASAGLVLGALVWIRAELAVLVLVMLAWAIVRRRPRLVLGLTAWPVAYAAAGAIYHAYVLWIVHYPPALPSAMPDNPFWQPDQQRATVVGLASAGVALTPAVVSLVWIRPRGFSALERAWLGFAVIFVVALVVLPRWGVFNFDQSPRYLMPVLPVVALAVSRSAERWGSLSWIDAVLAIVVAGLAIAMHRGGGPLSLAICTFVVASAAALSGWGRPRLGVAALSLLLAVGARSLADGARLDRRTQASAVEQMAMRVSEFDPAGTRPVVTNEPILAAYLARSGDQPQRPVHYIVQADQVYELTQLTNPVNGQRRRIFAALAEGMYGIPIFPDAMTPARMPPDALLVLKEDRRLSMVMPPSTWTPAMQVLSASAEVTLAELIPEVR